jgi:hypothetical protein
MILLGVILLVLGLILDIGLLVTLGLILAVIGAVLWAVGTSGRSVGGRRHWF